MEASREEGGGKPEQRKTNLSSLLPLFCIIFTFSLSSRGSEERTTARGLRKLHALLTIVDVELRELRGAQKKHAGVQVQKQFGKLS